jgi:hypothetical protein
MLPVAFLWLPLAAAELAGEYTVNLPEVASGLLLRPGGAFEYYFTYGAADYTAQGSWRTEPGFVVLTASGGDGPPFRLLKSAAGAAAEIRVHVRASNGRGVQHIVVKLATSAGEEEARTGADGIALLPRKSPPRSLSFHVPVYGVDAGPFDVPAGAGEFWFEIDAAAITRVPFRNERLKIVNNDLEMTFWKTAKPMRYRRR